MGLLILTPALPAVSAEPGELTGFEYVSLGDSYPGGFGLTSISATSPFSPVAPAVANGCFQGEWNYPHLVAADLGLTIDDQSCSGANTANLGYPVGASIPPAPVVPAFPALPNASVVQTTAAGQTAPQLQTGSLSATTDIVTVTIGGNDFGFADIVAACVRLSDDATSTALGLSLAAGITVANCEDYFDDETAHPDAHLRTWLTDIVEPRINAVFDQIAAEAPNARVFAVGYPRILTADASLAAACFASPLAPAPHKMPFSAADILFLHEMEELLDSAIESAAAGHGFNFVSAAASTEGHALCDPDPWMEELAIQFEASPGVCPAGYLPAMATVCVIFGALHPTSPGVANLRSLVSSNVNAAFGLSVDVSSAPQGDPVTVSGLGYYPGEQVSVAMGSSTLGTFTADSGGAFSAGVAIPADAVIGTNALVATGLSSDHEFVAALTIEAAAVTGGGGGLAATGPDAAAPVLIALLLVVGGILLAATRQRHTAN